ncbi:MAG: hypothetical protein ACTSYC_07050 [Promethearchaeota archaeon]
MEEKKRKLRGFAGIIAKNLEPLNNIEKFKEKYKDADLKILLNATDGKYAALIKVKNGTVEIEGIKNDDKENLKKEVLGWDGKLETTTELFLKLASGELSSMKMLLKLITRKIKIKGSKYVMELNNLFSLLEQ